MLDRLLARCSFQSAGHAVTCAFSGGPDSTALLALAGAAGLTVTAIHVDHGMRPESAAEAEQACRLADALGVTVRVVRAAIEPGGNLEARARAARRAALPPDALTGHTADDRAETVLLNLLRGSGPDGLAAMGPSPTRPIVRLRRVETRAVCTQLGLEPVEDPSNADRRFVRNRVRHELLPLLDDIAGRDVVPLLLRMADVVADDATLADAASASLDPTDARALAGAPPAAARRALRRWLTDDGYPPDLATLGRVLDVALGRRAACEVSGGRRVERHHQRLSITTSAPVASVDGMGRS